MDLVKILCCRITPIAYLQLLSIHTVFVKASQKKFPLVNVVFLPNSDQAPALFEAELAFFSFNPAPHSPSPTQESLFCGLYEPDCNQTLKVRLIGNITTII